MKKKIKTMNTEMITNSQLSTTESKKTKTNTKTKQITRTGTDSEKWTSHGGLSVGRERGRMGGEKVHETRSIIGRHKLDRGRLRIV